MTSYEVNKKIDYIQFSSNEFRPLDDIFGKSEQTKPRNKNYNTALEYECGVIVQRHTEYDNMKTNILMTGSTLDTIRDTGITDSEICQWCCGLQNAKFSRIDIAITSKKKDGSMHGLLPHMINYYAGVGAVKTKLQLDNPVTSSELEVQTCYIGSRKSRNRLFRAYDKGIDIGQEARRIIRYELETRKNATHIAMELCNEDCNIGSIMRRYVDMDNKEWLEIMSAPQSKNFREDDSRPNHIILREKHNARLTWIFNSVTPAIAKVLDYEDISPTLGSDKIWQLIQDSIDYHRNRQ